MASVKSQDELLSALFTLLAFSYSITLIKADKYSLKFGLLSFFCYILALFSKEGAVAMLLIFPLAFMILFSQPLKRSLLYSAPYAGAALIFLFARNMVLSGEVQNYHNTVLENVLYNAGSFAQASATKMEILFHYLRLLFVPLSLSWDYSYNQVPLVNWDSFLAWISLLFYAGMLGFAILKLKKKPVISFAILFYLIMLAPTSNFFFLIGTVVSERFLFLPSLGFIIVLVYGLAGILKIDIAKYNTTVWNKLTTICLAIFILFTGLTISRSNDWQSNFTIYKAGAENAPNSSRTNNSLGNKYRVMAEQESDPQLKAAYFANAIKYLKASLVILPSNKDALYGLGVTYGEMGDNANSLESYRNTIKFYPDHRSALNNIGSFFLNTGKLDSAYLYLKRCYDVDTTIAKSSQNLAAYYFKMGNSDQSIQFAKNAIRLDKYIRPSYELLINVYKAMGNMEESAKYEKLYHESAAEDPNSQSPKTEN